MCTCIPRDENLHRTPAPESRTCLGTELAQAIEWTQAHAAEMRVPCLIVYGSDDRLVPPEGSRIFYESMTLADKERQTYTPHDVKDTHPTQLERIMLQLS